MKTGIRKLFSKPNKNLRPSTKHSNTKLSHLEHIVILRKYTLCRLQCENAFGLCSFIWRFLQTLLIGWGLHSRLYMFDTIWFSGLPPPRHMQMSGLQNIQKEVKMLSKSLLLWVHTHFQTCCWILNMPFPCESEEEVIQYRNLKCIIPISFPLIKILLLLFFLTNCPCIDMYV